MPTAIPTARLTESDALRIIVARAAEFEPHTAAAKWSGGRWKPYRHLAYLGRIIERAVNRGNGRVVINMGPGQGKSQLLSKWVPVWGLELFPHWRVMIGTHTSGIAGDWGKAVRDEFAENPMLSTKLEADTLNRSAWNTTAGGGLRCLGVGGSSLGYRANLFIIDDPYGSWADAWSGHNRRLVEEWFDATANTRLEPNATVIVLHHRMHPKDLTWYLTESGRGEQWQVVRLPSLAEADDPLGRAPGAALCPERFDTQALDRIRRAAPLVFDAMHQQSPRAVGVGAAYPQFTQANVDTTIAPRFDRPLAIAFDFNVNPGMHVELGQYDSAADLFTITHEIHGPRMSLREALESVAQTIAGLGRFPELHVFGDASGSASSITTGASCYDLIRQRLARIGPPVRMRVPNSNPPIVDRVNALRDALADVDGTPRVKIHPRCVRLLTDFRELQTDHDGEIDKSDPLLSHASEAVGYMVHYLRPAGGRVIIPRGRFITR